MYFTGFFKKGTTCASKTEVFIRSDYVFVFYSKRKIQDLKKIYSKNKFESSRSLGRIFFILFYLIQIQLLAFSQNDMYLFCVSSIDIRRLLK